MPLRLLFLTIFCLCLSIHQARTQFLFDNLKSNDGLSAREVHCVIRDKEGFIWMGTTNGLNRFDGSQFKIWNHSSPGYPEKLGQSINCIIEYRNKIWIGTESGVANLDKSSSVFQMAGIRSAEPDGNRISVTRFQIDKSGRLWIATDKGIFIEKNSRFEPVSTQFPFAKEVEKFSCFYSSFIYDSARNSIWAGTLKGTYLINLDKKELLSFKNNTQNFPFLNDHVINSIAFDKNGDIWWGDASEGSLNFYDFNTREFQNIKNINDNPAWRLVGGTNTLYCDKKGRLWISTWLYTAFIRHPDGRFEMIPYDQYLPYSIGYGNFMDVLEDEYDNIWLGTINGVSRFSENRFINNIIKAPSFKYYLPTGFANINMIMPGKNGVWWLAKMEGLLRYDTASGKFDYYTPYSGITPWNELFDIDTIDNEIWCSSANGIQIFNDQTRKFRLFNYFPKDKGGKEKPVSWVFKDSKGFIWIGVWGNAVYRYDPRTHQCIRFDGSDPSLGEMNTTHSSAIFETDDQTLWVSSGGDGLRIFDMRIGRFNKPPATALQEGLDYSITQDKNGFVWVSTSRNTVLRCTRDGKVLDSLTTRRGLTGNYFHHLCFDEAGRLWVISREGMFCIETTSKKVIPVELNINFSFNDHWNSLLKVGNNLYGTMLDNMVIIDTRKFRQLPEQVPPLISGFHVFQEERPMDKNIPVKLNYKENFFSIEFSSPFHREYSSIQYAYKLEGFDKDWVYCGRKQTAEYTNVPSGNFTFLVKSTDGTNKWMEKTTSFSILVKPPFWKTAWFIILVIILLAFLARVLWLRRKSSKQRKQLDQTIDYFANSVYGENSVNEICWDIARNCISQLQFEDCVVYLRDKEKNKLVQKAAYGPKNPKGHEIENPIEIEWGKGIVGAAALTGKPQLVNDTSKDERYIIDDEPRFSELAVPILHDNEVIGVIDSEHSKKNFYTAEHVKTLNVIASISANKIAEAQAEAYARENEIKLLEINKILAESQLMALRAQMNPHFVFNCLNSIQECIVTQKYGEASNYLNKFSKLFRMVLNNSGKNLVTIDEEKEVLELYLELELMRFEKSFQYEIKVDDDLESEEILIPSMLLQPYVENALWHGLMHKEGERKLAISFEKLNDEVFCCTIDDNGIGRKRSFELKQQQSKTKRHESKGLKISKDRIDVLQKQGYHARLDIIDKYDETGNATGTKVVIELSTFLKS